MQNKSKLKEIESSNVSSTSSLDWAGLLTEQFFSTEKRLLYDHVFENCQELKWVQVNGKAGKRPQLPTYAT